MVVVHSHRTGDAVLVEGVAPLPLLGASHVPMAAREAPSAPRRRRDGAPMVGRDNSATRYQAVKDFKMGVRRQRRWDNLLALKHALKSLGHEEEEDVEEPIVGKGGSVLSVLLHDSASMQLWESFVACPAEEQSLIMRFSKMHLHSSDSAEDAIDLGASSPIRCYLRIDRSIRMAMRRRHLPLGLVEHLEARVAETFAADPGTVMLTELPDSYSRMLQHGICQYMGLKSSSADVGGARVTTITHPEPALGFTAPTIPLSAILSHAVEPAAL